MKHENNFFPEHLKDVKEYSFSPSISKNSILIAQRSKSKLNETTISDRFTKLHCDYIKRKNLLNQMQERNVDEECTFQPNQTMNSKIVINENDKKLLFEKLTKSKKKCNCLLI